jgi:hypothetical protein
VNAINRHSERRRIEKSFEVFGLLQRHRELIVEALDSDVWDWFRDCDGCTGVPDMYWPTKYFPPCLRHDFDWTIGNGGLDGSRTFYDLQRAYGMPRWRAGLRAAAVTVVWYGWSQMWREPQR